MTKEEVEEAKKWLNKLYMKADITDEYGDMEDMQPYEEAINMVTMALEQTSWIPVSESLPKKPGRYLAYIVNKHDTNCRYIMTCEYVESDLWCWFPDDECASDNVIAWMPLPKPYKAESGDKK